MKTVGKQISEWVLDQSNTAFEFQVKHMVVSTVNGRFSKFSGVMKGDPDDLSESLVDLVIESSSIDTHDRMRDKKLKNQNFFNVESYPHIRFWSTEIEQKEEGKYRIKGQLKIKDITREVPLTCELLSMNGDSFDFSVSGRVSSEDFGLKWKSFFDPGNILVGSTVKISVKGKFRLEKRGEPTV